LAPIGEADCAQARRHVGRIAARNFCNFEIRLTGNQDCAPAAASYDAKPPAAPPNSRGRDTISALAGVRRRPLAAAVAQSRACCKDEAANTRRKSGSPKLLTATSNSPLAQSYTFRIVMQVTSYYAVLTTLQYEAVSAYMIQPYLRSNARAVDRSLSLKIRYSVSDGPRGHCPRLTVARVGHISRQFQRTSSKSSKHATDSRSP